MKRVDAMGAAAPDGDAAYLQSVGDRLRLLRARRGMTRRILARDSGVSERYIAQMESGSGNVSILLLRRLAHALGTGVASLSAETAERPVDLLLLEHMLARLPDAELAQARAMLSARFGHSADPARAGRIALIGLHGAGKSTLGRALAERQGVRMVELDREIEQEAHMELREIFELRGQAQFRRFELAALKRLVAEGSPMVIATGGSLVTEPATFEFLLAHCRVIWVRTSPAEHMQRVIRQGDLRPMSENRRAMEDLHAILESRQTLYAKADGMIDTAGRSVEQSLEDLMELLGRP